MLPGLVLSCGVLLFSCGTGEKPKHRIYRTISIVIVNNELLSQINALQYSSIRIQGKVFTLLYNKQGLCHDSEAGTTDRGGESKFIPTQVE